MLIRFGGTLILLLLLIIEHTNFLTAPSYWLMAGIVLIGVTSEKLWKSPFILYLLLIIIVGGFTFLVKSPLTILFLPILFMFFYLRTETATRTGIIIFGFLIMLISVYNSDTYMMGIFLIICSLFAVSFMLYHQDTQQLLDEKTRGLEELSFEYTKLKRRIAMEEDALKQAERARIARDVHDSVGHQLTGLIMQLQMIEMTADEADPQISQAKNTARTALQEMRQAVQSMENDEKKGVPMIIQLVRKLEAESQTRITFTTKARALSVPLTDEQSVALYRFVQEGLTNAMRHAYARKVDVVLHIEAERMYVVTMKNTITEHKKVVEGFGLTQLRKRFERIEGSFRVQCIDGIFLAEGKFPLMKGEQ